MAHSTIAMLDCSWLMLNKIPRSDYWVCRVVQKPLWASLDHPAVWQPPLTKRFAPHIWRTLDGEGRRGSNKENWFVSMKFHRSLPKLWTKKMETGLGVQRARGWGKIAGWTLIEPNSWTWTWISNSLNYAGGASSNLAQNLAVSFVNLF